MAQSSTPAVTRMRRTVSGSAANGRTRSSWIAALGPTRPEVSPSDLERFARPSAINGCANDIVISHLFYSAATGLRVDEAHLRLARPVGVRHPVGHLGRRDGPRLVEMEIDLLARLRSPIAHLAEIVELALEASLEEGFQAAEQIAPTLAGSRPRV